MYRKISTMLLHQVLTIFIAILGVTCCFEPALAQGTNCSTAPSVAINPASPPSFTLTAGARHFFKIVVPSFSIPSSRVQLTTSTEGSTDTHGYLFYADGRPIDEDSISGPGFNFLISQEALAPGTYCLQVRGESTSTTGQYWPRVEGDLTNDTPGGSDFTSFFVVRSNLIAAKLSVYNDWDYFQIQVRTGGVVTVETQGSTDTHGYLFYADGRLIDEDSISGPGLNFRISVTLAPGIYYARVRGESPSIKGDYWLSVTGAVVPFPSALCASVTATIVGTEGPDIINGTAGNDVIQALGGNDTVYGLGGNDIICGGSGDDVLIGGDGNDRLYGETGNNVLRGERGADLLVGSTGIDILDGGSENDALYGAAGNDVLTGGLGVDVRDGGLNKDVCDKDVTDGLPIGCEATLLIP
jgi:Ca2+-binding RTX toxin-like protein